MTVLAIIGGAVVVVGAGLVVGFWLYRTEPIVRLTTIEELARERARQRRIQEVGTGICFVLMALLVIAAFVYDRCSR